MADGVAGRMGASVGVSDFKAIQGENYGGNINLDALIAFVAGTGAGQAKWAYITKATALAAASSQVYDVKGVLTNVHGDIIDMTKLKSVILINRSVTAAILALGGNAAEVPYMGAVNDKAKALPGGWCGFGYSSDTPSIGVTAATGDKVTVENLDGALAAIYDLIVVGV
jgi:hypothetical protein